MLLRRTVGLAIALLLLAGCTPVAKVPAQPSGQAGSADGGAAANPKPPERWFPTVGAPAAPVGGTDVLTKQRVLLTDLKGQVVFLNFWATWCGPCKDEMPMLDKLNQELAGKVKFLAIDVDANEEPGDIAAYAKELGVTLPLIWDEGKAGRTYYISGVPTSLVINRDGVIAAKKLGQVSRQEALDLIAAADK